MVQKKADAISKVVKAFDAFREAYDRYIMDVEDLMPGDEDGEDEYLKKRIASLVIGSGDVALYLRDYGYTVDAMRVR